MAEIHCKHFSGYKPCGLSDQCDFRCPQRVIPHNRLLIIHLGAMGAVLRATSILPAVKRKYPNAHITWVTDKPCVPLLKHNPFLDKVMPLDFDSLLELSNFNFDVVLNIEKSLRAGGVLKQIKYTELFGFKVDERSGAILPATEKAKELWRLGLSNQKKFYENQKPETQLLVESLDLGTFQRDPYLVSLTQEERELSHQRRKFWAPDNEIIIGLNTGCAATIPYKKMSVESQRSLIASLSKWPGVSIVLLGGPEDTTRNNEIARGTEVIVSPTQNGIRDGLVSVEACDMVISGDSLGMHMAIALNKWTIAWFGPTCEQEIDLYDRGVKIKSSLPCSPCWKRHCSKTTMCYEVVSQEELILAIKKGFEFLGRPVDLSYTATL